MPIIPSKQQFHTVSDGVDTINRGSALANADRQAFTMQDIQDTVSGSVGDIGGSIADNQVAVGATAADTIEGSSSLTYDGSSLTVTGQVNLAALNTAPLAATSTGTLGEIRWTATHVYLCTATDVWVRAVLATWP
tara:strand:- start:3301 stop:3705 length:405 start_codon:yes stop_codon:yes gene_type:complete